MALLVLISPRAPALHGSEDRYPALSVTAGVELTFYGVRGSTPCDGKRYERYGGDTSCEALEAPGHGPVIFDLGTGLRAYGDVVTDHYRAELEANRVTTPYGATVLLTH